jgi:S1-C subfamily serine protease
MWLLWMAINIFNDCINSYKQLGYIEIEQVGVPVFLLIEGNPPIIEKVQQGFPADRAGIMVGDKIVTVNGKKSVSIQDVIRFGFCKPGEPINFQIDRNGEIKEFTVIAQQR